MVDLLQYPAYDSFIKNVKLEAEQNLKRLRHHPSIVIFGAHLHFLAQPIFADRFHRTQPETTKVHTPYSPSMQCLPY